MIVINQDRLQDLLNPDNWLKFGLDLNKGFLLSGETGIGKTTLMNKYATQQKRKGWGDPRVIEQREGFPTDFDSTTLFQYILNYGEWGLKNLQEHDLYLDDLGNEPTGGKDYGTFRLPITELLTRRHLVRERHKTFACTNLSPDGLKEKYGDRIYSRLHEMMNFILVEGKDFRQKNLK